MSGIRPEGFRPETITCPDNLIITATYSFEDLRRKARDITLLDNVVAGFHPYRLSLITLEEVPLDQLHPCSLYVLESQLEITRQLRDAFLKQGVDPLRMTSDKALIEYRWDDFTHCVISPPIVEVSEDDGGILVLVDGLHRVWIARELGWDSVIVTKIENIACPLQPLPTRWDEISVFETVPPEAQKKRFRFNSPDEIRRWMLENHDRFIQGFDFPEKLSWMHYQEPLRITS